MKRLIILATLACAACSSVPAGQTLADSCLTADRLLRAAITLDKQGKINESQAKAITIAGTTINGACSQSSPPTDISSALQAVSKATADLSAIPGVL